MDNSGATNIGDSHTVNETRAITSSQGNDSSPLLPTVSYAMTVGLGNPDASNTGAKPKNTRKNDMSQDFTSVQSSFISPYTDPNVIHINDQLKDMSATLSRQNLIRTHSNTSSRADHATITYYQEGSYLTPKFGLYGIPSSMYLNRVFDELIIVKEPERFTGDITKPFKTLLLRQLRNCMIDVPNSNDSGSHSLRPASRDYEVDPNHICKDNTRMTFVKSKTPGSETLDNVCAVCVLKRLIAYAIAHHHKLVGKSVCSNIDYKPGALGKIILGMMLRIARSNDGTHRFKPEQMMMYPTEHAFKYALARAPLNYGHILDTEKIKSFNDLIIKSTSVLHGDEFLLHAAFSLMAYSHTFMSAGVRVINLHIAQNAGTYMRAVGINRKICYPSAYDVDCSGASSLFEIIGLSKDLIQSYLQAGIDVKDYIPCVSIFLHGVQYGDATQYRRVVANAITEAYIYLLSRAQTDASFANKYLLNDFKDHPFVKDGTIKIIGNGHSMGFWNSHNGWKKYEFDSVSSVKSLMSTKLSLVAHKYAMTKLEQSLVGDETIDISYIMRIREVSAFFRVNGIELKSQSSDDVVPQSGTGMIVHKDPNQFEDDMLTCAIGSKLNWGDIMEEYDMKSGAMHKMGNDDHCKDDAAPVESLRLALPNLINEMQNTMHLYCGAKAINFLSEDAVNIHRIMKSHHIMRQTQSHNHNVNPRYQSRPSHSHDYTSTKSQTANASQMNPNNKASTVESIIDTRGSSQTTFNLSDYVQNAAALPPRGKRTQRKK